jgi:predicted DNA binding CopG/RHH family protein
MFLDEATRGEHYSWYLRSGAPEYVLFQRETKVKRKGRSMSSNRDSLPQFSNEDEEREFWATHDSTEYVDWNRAERNPTFPRLKPSTRTVSIRLPESLIAALKTLANKKDVPYQSLVKMFLAEKVKEELSGHLRTDPN